MKSILFLFLFLSLNIFAQPGSFNDLFHIGEVSSGANVVIEVGDAAEFRYNFSTSKMQVSHDGVSYFDIVTVAPDHTLTSTDPVQNKTLDNTNLINSTKFNPVIEIGHDEISSGNRTSALDLHSSDGVDFSARIIRNAGANGTMQIVNTGTGKTQYYSGSSNLVMEHVNKGLLELAPQNSALNGGGIKLQKGPTAASDIYVDNDNSTLRFYDGATIRATINILNGAMTLNDVGGNGGNVPHNCSVRQTGSAISGLSNFGITASCAAGERATGCGIDFSTSANTIFYEMYPNSLSAPTACVSNGFNGRNEVVTITVKTFCCKY